MSTDDFHPTLLSRSTVSSSSSDRSSTIHDLETEFQTLRDQNLRYEDDVEFHIFIGVLDLVDSVVVERQQPTRGLRRRSFARLLGGFRKHATDNSNENSNNNKSGVPRSFTAET